MNNNRRKKNKVIKFKIESSSGSYVDMTKYFKGGIVQHPDGTQEMLINEQRLRELDAKYDEILKGIVKK